jgi:hypothetical protein
MDEITARMGALYAITSDKVDLPKTLAYELCYLQLRYICELIALGCLAAHGEVKGAQSSRFRKRREADWILNALEQLHPDFYPSPHIRILDEKGKHIKSEPIEDGFLSKKGLAKLYHECGGVLHRGSFDSLVPRKGLKLDQVKVWMEQISVLLSHHHIQLVDPTQQLWVLMNGPNKKARVSLMAYIPPSEPPR